MYFYYRYYKTKKCVHALYCFDPVLEAHFHWLEKKKTAPHIILLFLVAAVCPSFDLSQNLINSKICHVISKY